MRFISIRSGDRQVGVISQPLPQRVVVHVKDDNGAPIVMAAVIWKVVRGGGSVFVPDSLTDDNGNASAIWTMGPKPGPDSLSASLAQGAFVIFSATATPP
ncbi:MAG TPA: Ig-like domain-containing protein [Gemmatimonadaceae bacterium]